MDAISCLLLTYWVCVLANILHRKKYGGKSLHFFPGSVWTTLFIGGFLLCVLLSLTGALANNFFVVIGLGLATAMEVYSVARRHGIKHLNQARM